MDKVKLEYKTPPKEFEYGGSKISIKSFLDLPTQVFLIEEYIKDYFGDTDDILIENMKYHYLEAECKLMNYVYQLNTNIDIKDSVDYAYADSGMWNLITHYITNWKEFRKRLDNIVSLIKEQEKSKYDLGLVLSGLMEKIQSIVDQLTEISPEDIQNMQKVGEELIEKLEKSSVMANPSDLNAVEQPIITELKDGIKKE